ncbi:hypothetical protein IJE86_02705 [bacterium]|nr:hypothetical protein [bacterium]
MDNSVSFVGGGADLYSISRLRNPDEKNQECVAANMGWPSIFPLDGSISAGAYQGRYEDMV